MSEIPCTNPLEWGGEFTQCPCCDGQKCLLSGIWISIASEMCSAGIRDSLRGIRRDVVRHTRTEMVMAVEALEKTRRFLLIETQAFLQPLHELFIKDLDDEMARLKRWAKEHE